MKRPRFERDCSNLECKECVLDGLLCEHFESILDAMNEIAYRLVEASEEPKSHPQFNRGDKVQVSDNCIDWHDRYFVETEDEFYPFKAATFMNLKKNEFKEVMSWKHCRTYKEE